MNDQQRMIVLEEQLKELQERFDAQEQIVAQLTMAYSETWIVLEALLAQTLVERSEEEKTIFWKNLDQVRKNLYKEMSKASAGMATDHSDLESAITNLVTGESTTGTDQ